MLAVIDTNILVSALWTPSGNAAKVVANIIGGLIQPCHDYRIITEYRDILSRPKFRFTAMQVDSLLDVIMADGISVTPNAITAQSRTFADPDDIPFYEVALFCNAPLVTGNIRHFPNDPIVYSLVDFCDKFL